MNLPSDFCWSLNCNLWMVFSLWLLSVSCVSVVSWPFDKHWMDCFLIKHFNQSFVLFIHVPVCSSLWCLFWCSLGVYHFPAIISNQNHLPRIQKPRGAFYRDHPGLFDIKAQSNHRIEFISQFTFIRVWSRFWKFRLIFFRIRFSNIHVIP